MEATQTLREEHDVILRGLDVLSAMAAQAEAGELPPKDDVADILGFIQAFADAAHHHKEEGLLFPAMERAGVPSTGGPIAVMLSEHEEGRALVRRAKEAAAAGSAHDFAQAASGFVSLLRHHIDKENQVLFAIAEARIEAGAAAALDAEFAAAVEAQAPVRAAQIAKLEALEAKCYGI